MPTRQDIAALPAPYLQLYEALARIFPVERIVLDPLRRLAYGTDASFYRLVPQIVVKVRSEDEVVSLLGAVHAARLPVTFRAAGTSLSGQSISDSVLAVVAGGFRRLQVLDGGARVKAESGVIGAEVNAALAPYGKKMGPDPASIGAAMVGGIASNNASGMCCGTAENSYRTVESMKLVLADGTRVDTGDPASRAAFERSHAPLLAGLAAIRDEIAADEKLHRRIVEKYRIKNTTGYSLNAFVDFHDPVDILVHALIGAEGTLAFITEVTYQSVVEQPFKASALVLFPGIHEAARATQALQGGVVAAAELMDRASMRSVEDKPGMPPELRTLGPDAAALLVEVRAPDAASLEQRAREATARIAQIPTLQPVTFTAVKAETERLWDIRRGLFPAVGAARKIGTTVVIEDVAFPIQHLAEATVALQRLMKAHGYDGIIFGHALDGNLHFVFTQGFDAPGEKERYAGFMEDVCQMVAVKYDGSLKGEHGTGRNVAPFVELEWGSQAYALMKRLKKLLDPEGLLNPGVILNENKQSHVSNLKPLPKAHPILDRCIECGFCEPRCPSRDLTLTPRQRIVIQRELARLGASGEEPERRARLAEDYVYLGQETCAADGLCAIACPVGIDTGEHTKWLRAQAHEAGGVAGAIAGHFGATLGGVRTALRVADAAHAVLGTGAMSAIASGLRKASGGALPLWNPEMPRAVAPHLAGTHTGSERRVVYFPSCVARTFGPARGDDEGVPVYQAMLSLFGKARYDVVFPEQMSELCCGMPFESKGYAAEGERKARELEAALLQASEGGKLPIVFDTSPCAYRMRKLCGDRITIHDPVPFIAKELLPRLSLQKEPGPIAIHVPCSAVKSGYTDAFKAVAGACSDKVSQPSVNCCGFAGDRGFNYPELNASALQHIAPSLPQGCGEGFSSSRTCEIGLSLHAGIPYRSLAVLVDRCAAPAPSNPEN